MCVSETLSFCQNQVAMGKYGENNAYLGRICSMQMTSVPSHAYCLSGTVTDDYSRICCWHSIQIGFKCQLYEAVCSGMHA